jgi:broad specificity phosphatase PhoE
MRIYVTRHGECQANLTTNPVRQAYHPRRGLPATDDGPKPILPDLYPIC